MTEAELLKSPSIMRENMPRPPKADQAAAVWQQTLEEQKL
jgi:hypothetical protein